MLWFVYYYQEQICWGGEDIIINGRDPKSVTESMQAPACHTALFCRGMLSLLMFRQFKCPSPGCWSSLDLECFLSYCESLETQNPVLSVQLQQNENCVCKDGTKKSFVQKAASSAFLIFFFPFFLFFSLFSPLFFLPPPSPFSPLPSPPLFFNWNDRDSSLKIVILINCCSFLMLLP